MIQHEDIESVIDEMRHRAQKSLELLKSPKKVLEAAIEYVKANIPANWNAFGEIEDGYINVYISPPPPLNGCTVDINIYTELDKFNKEEEK